MDSRSEKYTKREEEHFPFVHTHENIKACYKVTLFFGSLFKLFDQEARNLHYICLWGYLFGKSFLSFLSEIDGQF